MRRNTVVSVTALTLTAALGLTACSGTPTGSSTGTADSGGDTGAAATTVFKVAFNQQPNHPQYRALDAMGDRIKERTDGAYDLEIFPNETLGAQKETIELVQSGAIEFSMVASPLLENFNPDFVVFNLPFTFDSQDHQRETTNDPEIVSELYASLDDQDLHVLASFHGGVRSMYNAEKPIETPADLAGMKVRVIESDTNIEMIRLMGGTGTPMGMGEVYTAIQSGVIDAAENNELTYANVKHSEVAPYYSYTRHLMLPDYLITNPAVMDALPPDVQEIFAEELAAAVEEEGEIWKTEIETAKEMAVEAGATFNEVDADAFADVIRPLTEAKLDNDVIREIHAKVRAAAE
ncbi:TRAP transporter substrate-binding protein [Cellulomonas biazotea]|jgi:tripartite ATP-independent transporter DctP family solute receptor|uniref:C4-dicarboxylate ABC transporter substrate-binding protein n=1 Tax=Cellulomonas biazotea TaxID=1709 RepID=A0A402DU84_9CELL|nr:TRAP transporter substrate-binding protein [Cellulomonas biazotea]GCE77646.1 C4-dicarboxylate ABC transporter substrate-binding protein [Cellulomonas biazotea]